MKFYNNYFYDNFRLLRKIIEVRNQKNKLKFIVGNNHKNS